MHSTPAAPRARLAVTWLATTLASAAVIAWATPDLVQDGARPLTFETLLVSACAGAVVACAAWAWLVTTVVLLEALRRSTRPTPGVPAWARRTVLAACGLAVVGASGTAYATPGAIEAGTGDPDRAVVAGLPLPDRATGGARPPTLATTPRPATTRLVVVQPGDSLWSIATTELGTDPTAAAISTRARLLHEMNRAVIGADPDLIQPGHQLRTPPHEPRPAR